MQEEFSRIIPLSDVGTSEITEEYTASADELETLAKRFHVVSIGFFKLQATVAYIRDGEYSLNGKISASVTDKSVISLEPVSYEVSDSFKTIFSKYTEETDDNFDIDSPDTEILESDEIDAGKIAAEYLALSLDPFPHKEGEVFEYKGQNSAESNNPFAELQKLKDSFEAQEE